MATDCYSKALVDLFVSLKADKVTGATLDNIVILKQSGNIYDSGVSINDLILDDLVDGGTF